MIIIGKARHRQLHVRPSCKICLHLCLFGPANPPHDTCSYSCWRWLRSPMKRDPCRAASGLWRKPLREIHEIWRRYQYSTLLYQGTVAGSRRARIGSAEPLECADGNLRSSIPFFLCPREDVGEGSDSRGLLPRTGGMKARSEGEKNTYRRPAPGAGFA